jgi:tetratricopeptide (TPR) repeat protein
VATNRHRTIDLLKVFWRRSAGLGVLRAAASIACVMFYDAARAGNPAPPLVVHCDDRFEIPLLANSLKFVVEAPERGGWLTVREIGQDLEVDGLPDPTISIQVPPRFGRILANVAGSHAVAAQRLRPGGAIGFVGIALECDKSPKTSTVEWLREASVLAARCASPDQELVDALLASLDREIATAPTRELSALALHLRAQALFVNGRSRDAADAFGIAAIAWSEAGRSDESLAARVGQSDDLIRSGAYDDAISKSKVSIGQPRTPYFATRLAATRCLAEHYLGRVRSAESCYHRTISDFERIGESLEAAAGAIDMSALLREQGLANASVSALRHALSVASGPQSASVRGRAYLGLADIDLERGDVGVAIGDADRAMRAFSDAHQPRWQANTLLKVADIYLELGAPADAHHVIDGALSMLSHEDAPARVAAAKVMRARAASEMGNGAIAATDLDAAIAIYERLAMPAEHSTALTARRRQALRDGEKPESDSSRLPNTSGVDDLLLAAETDLALGRVKSGRSALDRLDRRQLRLRDAIEWTRLRALALAAAGHRNRAITTLLSEVATLRRIASSSLNPLFAELVLAQQDDLRREAVDLLAQDIDARTSNTIDVAHRLWRLVVARSPVPKTSNAQLNGDRIGETDRALAREFLTPSNSIVTNGPPAYAALLALAGEPPTRSQAQAYPSIALEAVQHKLATNAGLLGFVAGRKTTIRIWLTQEALRLDTLPGPAQVSADIAALRSAVQDSNSSFQDAAEASAGVQHALLRGLEEEPSPERLLILAMDYGTTVPWAAMSWPKSKEPMGLSIALSLADFATTPHEVITTDSDTSISVLASPQSDSPLASLAEAKEEAAMIATASDRPVELVAASRTDLRAALGQAGLLHIGAHGRGQDDRIGASGLWLDSQGDAAAHPDYFSTIDVVSTTVRRHLVVLNACNAGGYAQQVGNHESTMADALIRAGAAHVIAAQWAVSDSATAVWVPNFYRRLWTSSTLDPSAALTATRQRIRDTRMFRSPFYWASWEDYVSLAY